MSFKFNIDGYNNFFFDFDGVIVDSVNIKTEAYASFYRPFGKKISAKVVSHHLAHGGIDRFTKFRHYHRTFLNRDISEQEINRMAKKFSDYLFERVIKAPLINGALKFLDLLRENNKKLFLVSATPEGELKAILKNKGLHKYFTEIRGSPVLKKTHLKALLEKYKLSEDSSVYFGDSNEDLKAAESLGINFIPLNFFNKKRGVKDFIELMQG